MAALHFWLFAGPLGERLEPKIIDAWLRWRGPIESPRDILIIGIDESTYAQLGLSPLEPPPRGAHAKLLLRLRQYGVKLAVFDLLFQEPGLDPAGDYAFAEAMNSMPTAIARISRRQRKTSITGKTEVAEQRIDPIGLFAERAAHVFPINIQLDDGVVRRFVAPPDSREPVSLAPALFKKLPESLPTGRDFILFYGPAHSMRSISYGQVLADDDLQYAEYFTGAVAFVGMQQTIGTGLAAKDSFRVSGSPGYMSGVEIHATIAANLLEGRWLRRFSAGTELATLNILAFVLTIVISGFRPLAGATIALASAIVWAILSYQMFLNGYFLPGLMLTTAILPSIAFCSTIFHYMNFRRSHESLQTALGIKLEVRG